MPISSPTNDPAHILDLGVQCAPTVGGAGVAQMNGRFSYSTTFRRSPTALAR